MDVTTYAVRALMRTLRDKLPPALVALDAGRQAQLVCGPGPYGVEEIEEDLILNGESVTIPGGVYTAAELVPLLTFPGLVASVIGDAVVFTAPLATDEEPSRIEVGDGLLNDTLGIHAGLDDQVILALAEPAPIFIARSLMASDADVTQPVIAVDRENTRPAAQYTTGEVLISVRLEVLYPGPVGAKAETLEAVHALVAAIYDVIAAGDERGPYMVGGEAFGARIGVCRPRALQIESTVRGWGRGSNVHPVGRALPEFEIQVWQ